MPAAFAARERRGEPERAPKNETRRDETRSGSGSEEKETKRRSEEKKREKESEKEGRGRAGFVRFVKEQWCAIEIKRPLSP